MNSQTVSGSHRAYTSASVHLSVFLFVVLYVDFLCEVE